MASQVSGAELPLQENEGVVEALPDWQNPDGEALLTAALSQEDGRPARDSEGLDVKPIFGQNGIEQGLALLQMICETLRLPFRRDVVDRMLQGMLGNKTSPTLENPRQDCRWAWTECNSDAGAMGSPWPALIACSARTTRFGRACTCHRFNS